MKISLKNSKLGKIPNFNLVPVRDCINCQECKKDCYALKAYKQYPATRAAWLENHHALKDQPELLNQLSLWFATKKKKPELFRIHVAGDFISQEYLDTWCAIARENPETTFLAFTKSHDLDYSDIPSNLQIIFSQWPGQALTLHTVNAWISTDNRAPGDAFVCPGGANKNAPTCEQCRYCFDNPQADVVFPIH